MDVLEDINEEIDEIFMCFVEVSFIFDLDIDLLIV